MQRNFYQVNSQQSNIASLFRTLPDRNMEMGCHAIFFLERLNLVPRGNIILDRTHIFHGILSDSPENQRKLSVYEKFYHPRNQTRKRALNAVNAWKPFNLIYLV